MVDDDDEEEEDTWMPWRDYDLPSPRRSIS